MKEAFIAEGHTVVSFAYANKDSRIDPDTEKSLTAVLHTEVPDAVFSFNFFPVISGVCKRENVRYISWIYDSPYVMLYNYQVINPCNEVYVFDKETYLEFHNNGIGTVRYMPMAAATDRLDKICQGLAPKYDVSFVGSLYTEEHNFFDRMKGLSDYTKGYLEALMDAQMKVQGYNFIRQSLSSILDDLYKALPMEPNPDGVETKEYLYSEYVINRKITGLERQKLLTAIGEAGINLDLFTHDKNFALKGIENRGVVGYSDDMPKVFAQSRINLNISLRSIHSGIPLRCFDIMGAGGFLLSNYQADFLDDFIPGEDFDYYESEEDLIDKIYYYLSHEDERLQIAQNGHDKVAAAHTFRHRIREML